MGGWPRATKAAPETKTPVWEKEQKIMSTTTSAETNNNDISSFDVVESGTAVSRANTLWVKLTPQVLKAIIVILTATIVICTTVTVVIVVTHIALRGGVPPVNTTLATPTTSFTTTTTPPESTSTSRSTTPSTATSTSSSSSSSSSSTTTLSSSPSSSTPMLSPLSSSTTTLTTTSTTSRTTSTTSSSTSSTSATTTATTSPTTVPECAQTQFLCGSGECIAWRNLCDGLPHCGDGSDEGLDCVCGADQWRCASGQCVPADARCDQVHDCLDSSDEMMCPDCSGFQCDTGLCLWDGNLRRCNSVFDCPDLSDEMGCSGRAGTRQCNNTVRVLQSQWCDGIDNCGDNSDETNCTAACRGMRMACGDGQCVMKTWRCDGYADCRDATDEVGCGTCKATQFMCGDYRCVGEGAVCDGAWDCRTGEDELHCFSAQEEDRGVLWARYQGQDYAVCSDHWTTHMAQQVCTDIDQLQLAGWKEVEPEPSITHFVAFTNNTLSAQTTNLAPRHSCQTGKLINITCHKEECGGRRAAFLQSFVAGGQAVAPGKWPWVVSLLHLGRFLCGGTLVGPRWVLTAAHCILSAMKGDYNFTSTPFYFDVLLGSTHNLGQSRLGTPVRVRVKRVVLYPRLTRPVWGGVDWDLALLELSVAPALTDHIQPVCLPHQAQAAPLTALCYLAGWGLMNPQQVLPTEYLRDTRMQLWSDTRCARNTIPGETTVNTNSTLCGGFIFGKPSSCQGDSGGPLMCLAANNRWMLVGVMSRGSSPCGSYIPNIRANRFARVANVVDWIRQHTWQET